MFTLQVKVGLLGKVEERFNKNLELEKQILLEKIKILNNETEKIKEIIAQLYKYNQTIEIQLPPEQKSKAEKISSTLGDIVKGFIF
jgi:enoyl reductase-like protein